MPSFVCLENACIKASIKSVMPHASIIMHMAKFPRFDFNKFNMEVSLLDIVIPVIFEA